MFYLILLCTLVQINTVEKNIEIINQINIILT